MLRKLRKPPPDLRRLFETLKSLQNDHDAPIALTEHTRGAPARTWDSVAAMSAATGATGEDDNEPAVRIFRQVPARLPPPRLLTAPLETVSAGGGIEAHRIRRLIAVLGMIPHSPLGVAKEVFYWLEQLRSSPMLSQLTPYAWRLLWALEVNPMPSARSRVIGDAMVTAGVPLSDEQEIAYIGGLFWNGCRDAARSRWIAGTKRAEVSAAYWNLGIRLYALDQQPDMASYWLQTMVRSQGGRAEPKSFIPVIMAYNHIYQSSAAWRCYTDMRAMSTRTKTPITASQYDTISMSFLDGNAATRGLEVYKHLYAAVPSAHTRLQTEIYNALPRAVAAGQAEATSARELKRVSVDAVKNLPKKVADKIFYTSWLRNLLRLNRPDLGARLLTEIMPAASITPDSIHYNALLRSYLQTNQTSQADSLAASMITSRLSPSTPSSTPAATRQTFSLLLRHHASRRNTAAVTDTAASMDACGFSPDVRIYNHILLALLRGHDYDTLSATWAQLLTSGLTPDAESWRVMWTAQSKTAGVSAGAPTSRALFATMVEKVPRGQGAIVQGVWAVLLHSFLRTRDTPGLLVALHAGRVLWGVGVDSAVARVVAAGVVRGQRGQRASMRGGRRETKGEEAAVVDTAVSQLTDLGRHLVQRRRKGAWRGVRDPEGLLEGVTALLRFEMGEGFAVRGLIEQAKEDMGVAVFGVVVE